MIQPCMFPYQMIKRQLVNMYVFVKHTNEMNWDKFLKPQ